MFKVKKFLLSVFIIFTAIIMVVPTVVYANTSFTPILSCAPSDYTFSDEYRAGVRQEFYRLINSHRAANNLRDLEINPALQIYTDIRAEEQLIEFGHTRPDGSSAGSGWYNSRNNINTRYAENALIISGTACAISDDPITTAYRIFSAWRESPGHNRHMLFNFSQRITMAFSVAIDICTIDSSFVIGAIFASGYGQNGYVPPPVSTPEQSNVSDAVTTSTVAFANMRTFWEAGRFQFRFSFNTRESAAKAGFAFASQLGALEYVQPVWGRCGTVGFSLSMEDALELWMPGETYNWLAFIEVNGQETESRIQAFTFTLP